MHNLQSDSRKRERKRKCKLLGTVIYHSAEDVKVSIEKEATVSVL